MTPKFALFDSGELRPSTREQRDTPIRPSARTAPEPDPRTMPTQQLHRAAIHQAR